jgi:hypothetical protein
MLTAWFTIFLEKSISIQMFKKFSAIIRKLKIVRVHKGAALDPIMKHSDYVSTFTPIYQRPILILSSTQRLGLTSGSSP